MNTFLLISSQGFALLTIFCGNVLLTKFLVNQAKINNVMVKIILLIPPFAFIGIFVFMIYFMTMQVMNVLVDIFSIKK